MKWDVSEGELPMWVADMDFETAPQITKALTSRAEHGVFGYTVIPEAWYGAIASWWKRRHGFAMEKGWLQFCTGVVPAISCIVKRVTNLGDRVAVLTPAYDIFYHSIENAGRTVLSASSYIKTAHITLILMRLKRCSPIRLRPCSSFAIPTTPRGTFGRRRKSQRSARSVKNTV